MRFEKMAVAAIVTVVVTLWVIEIVVRLGLLKLAASALFGA